MNSLFKQISIYSFIFILGVLISYLLFGNNNSNKPMHQPDVMDNQISDSRNNQGEESADDYLAALLVQYEKTIASLQNQNDSLLKQTSFSENQFIAMSSKPTIERKINSMSDSAVLKKLGLIFSDEQMENIQNPKDFARRLTEVALEESTDNQSGSTENTNVDVRISISHSIGYQEAADELLVASKFKRLYANILSSEIMEAVLVKWKNLSTGELLFYKGISLNQLDGPQFIWAKPKNGWETDTYQINMYKIGAELQLLASKQFTISNVIDDGPEQVSDEPIEGISIRKNATN